MLQENTAQYIPRLTLLGVWLGYVPLVAVTFFFPVPNLPVAREKNGTRMEGTGKKMLSKFLAIGKFITVQMPTLLEDWLDYVPLVLVIFFSCAISSCVIFFMHS